MKPMIMMAACLVTTCVMGSCVTYEQVKYYIDKEDGRVVLNDGRELQGRVLMPKAYTKTIRITQGDGKAIKVPAADVKVLSVWKKTHPDIVHAMVYQPYMTNKLLSAKQTKRAKPMWMAVVGAGEYVDFFSCSEKYSIPSSGDMRITSGISGNIFIICRKKGEDIGKMVGFYDSSNKQLRKELVGYLSDDLVLCDKLEKKEIDAHDFQEIAKQYKPVE